MVEFLLGRLPAFMLLACLVPNLWAQKDAQAFDPARDLAGFEEARGSEYRDLYPLDRYAQLLGKEMEPAELEAVRREWERDLEKLAPELSKLKADPAYAFRYLLMRRLSRDGYFGDVALDEQLSDGWLYLVQGKRGPEPERTKAVVATYGPWLKALSEVFQKDFVQPMQLKRRGNHGGQAVCVLRSRGDFDNYLRSSQVYYAASIQQVEATYDPMLGMVVAYDDPKVGTAGPQNGKSVASMGARALLHAHYQGKQDRISQLWLEFGLAAWLVPSGAARPEDLSKRGVDPAKLATLAVLATASEEMAVALHSVERLENVRDMRSVLAESQQRAKEAQLPFEAWAAWYGFWAESEAWIGYFSTAHGGRHLDGFRTYLGRVLAGEEKAGALRQALGVDDMQKIEGDFWLWVLDEVERTNKNLKLDRAPLEARLRKARVNSQLQGFAPASLALKPEEIEAHHGKALVLARAGDLDGAILILDGVLKGADGAQAERATRDVANIRGARNLRDSLLEYLQRKGERLQFIKDGRKYPMQIEAVESGVIRFKANKRNMDQLRVAELPIEAVAKQAEKPESQGPDGAWARGFVMLLCGLPDWQKRIKGEAPEAVALRTSKPEGYARLMRIGAAAAAVEALSRLPLPKDAAAAGEVLAAVARVQQSWDLDVVTSRRDDLERFARIALDLESKAANAATLIGDGAEDLGGGRVRIKLDFESPADASMLANDPDHIEGLPDLALSKEPEFVVVNGMLRMTGSASRRLPLPFASPMRLSLTWSTTDRTKGLASMFRFLRFNACDEPDTGNVGIEMTGGFGIIDVSGVSKSPSEVNVNLELGKPYAIEMVHDGQQIRTLFNGRDVDSSNCGPRKGGYVGVTIHTDHYFWLHDFEVEGAVPEAALVQLREGWIERRLAALRF